MVTAARGRPTSLRPGLPRALLVAALLAGFLVQPPAQPARADTMFGHDVSWPQCSTAEGGYGLPMPPASTQFVIIGLTRGLAFTENPCLAGQVHWLRAHGKPGHGYAMGTFPTPSQLSTYGDDGPWDAATRGGQLRNVGYAQATFALASMARIDWRPPVVWIDVEPRRNQPWPTGTAEREQENRAVLEGLAKGLGDRGFAHGFYSYTYGWRQIVGDWRLPTVPVWATAGRLDYPGEARDRCTQPSFSGGPVRLAQWTDGTRDYNLTCNGYVFQAT